MLLGVRRELLDVRKVLLCVKKMLGHNYMAKADMAVVVFVKEF